jgi:hypothetical protein
VIGSFVHEAEVCRKYTENKTAEETAEAKKTDLERYDSTRIEASVVEFVTSELVDLVTASSLREPCEVVEPLGRQCLFQRSLKDMGCMFELNVLDSQLFSLLTRSHKKAPFDSPLS